MWPKPVPPSPHHQGGGGTTGTKKQNEKTTLQSDRIEAYSRLKKKSTMEALNSRMRRDGKISKFPKSDADQPEKPTNNRIKSDKKRTHEVTM